jgi:hypothetical protein
MLTGLAIDRLEAGLGIDSIPEPLRDCPDVDYLEWVYLAFMELSTCRAMGLTLGPIPWTAIRDYANELELVEYSRELLFSAIRGLDRVLLEYYGSKAGNQGSQDSGGRETSQESY